MADWYEPAAKIHDSFSLDLERIRNNNRLSPDGKRAQIASAWQRAQAATTALKAEAKQKQAAETKRRELRLFGSVGVRPGDAIDRRDAQDRAEATKTAQEGSVLLARAIRTGDENLAQAVLRVALDRLPFERPWREVIKTWGDEHPNSADDLRASVEAHTPSRSQRARSAVFDDAVGSVPRPAELANLSDREVETLASGS